MFPLKDNIPTERFPVVTVALIALNVIAYFFFQHGTISLGDPSNDPAYVHNLWDYAYIPHELTHGDQCLPQGSTQVVCGDFKGLPATWITVFTAMFMHGGLFHLGGNMLFLWIFGNNVEDSMGPLRFIVFYLLAGLAADAAHIIPTIPIQSGADVPTLGASGAVAGILGGYLLLFPQARVVTVIFIIFFFTILEIPAILFLGIWILEQAVFAYFDLLQPTGEGGGVAYFAHIGGFLFGLLLIRLFASERRRLRQIERMG